MPNPKTRHSKQRKRKRRTHYKIEAPNVNICGNCGEAVLFHHICKSCGHYRGKVAIAKAVEATEE